MLEILLVRKRANSEYEEELYWASITDHLAYMAKKAGIYECLWHPEVMNITKASELVISLQNALDRLKMQPLKFSKYEDKDKWGTYKDLCSFIRRYLDACRLYPDADVLVSLPTL